MTVTTPSNTKINRLIAFDAWRGAIMILMALDHASYFVGKVHRSEFWGLPLPVYDGFVPFFTRFITHLCAPGFFLLMGVGMVFFSESRLALGWSTAKITRYFAIRGLLLIILQQVVENPAWLLGMLSGHIEGSQAPPGGGGEILLHFGVLYALGISMLVWAFAQQLPSLTVASFSGVALLLPQFTTPAVDGVRVLYALWLRLLFIPGQTEIWNILYPAFPWLGITGLGLLLGQLILKDKEQATRVLFWAGFISLLLFGLMRGLGGFGNLHPPIAGLIGFLNVTKYPPSLVYLTLTLGLNAIMLYSFTKIEAYLSQPLNPLLIFGKTALFFYLVHLYLYAAFGFMFPAGTSFPLMYLFWLLGLAILYPLCYGYRTFKSRQPTTSLWRFF